jgi:hypothetical protein
LQIPFAAPTDRPRPRRLGAARATPRLGAGGLLYRARHTREAYDNEMGQKTVPIERAMNEGRDAAAQDGQARPTADSYAGPAHSRLTLTSFVFTSWHTSQTSLARPRVSGLNEQTSLAHHNAAIGRHHVIAVAHVSKVRRRRAADSDEGMLMAVAALKREPQRKTFYATCTLRARKSGAWKQKVQGRRGSF